MPISFSVYTENLTLCIDRANAERGPFRERGEAVDEFDKLTFAKNLRVQRAVEDVSQAQLSRMVGMSPDTISKYESGSYCPSADKLWDLARVLHCSPNDLLGWPKPRE